MTDVTRVEAADDAQGLDEATAPARRRPGRRGLLLLGAVLLVLLVAGVVVAVVTARRVHAFDQAQQDRGDAEAVATQFTLRMDNYDTKQFGKYAKSVTQLLTTKEKAKFQDQYKAYQQQLGTAPEVNSSGKVLVAGVGDSDSDSATVLVVHDVTAKSGKSTVLHHYRWTVDLAKVGDRWLVDDFNQVG
ncbi:MAG TPA: hypothetical protein VI452_07210 [Marmoricola sp.]